MLNRSCSWICGIRIYKLGIRSHSSILRTPAKSAPREAPTPLVFVSVKAWDIDSYYGMTAVSTRLANDGFTCLQTDISLPENHLMMESSQIMQHFESELRDAIRLFEIPFPPVLFARSSACVIAQTYVSSHSASGLFLISPPVSNSSLTKDQLPTNLKEFDFEPRFPLAIMATPREAENLRLHNRLGKNPDVEIIPISSMEESHIYAEIEKWLDEVGM